MRTVASIVAALVVTILAFGGSALAAEPQFTPLGAWVSAPPQPVRASDGRVHLVYEINLLSIELGGTVPVEVQSLDVRTPGGRSLASLTGSELVMTTGAPLTLSTTLAPGAGGTVWLDVTLPRGDRVPRAPRC